MLILENTVAFNLVGPAGPTSQFLKLLNGTHDFSGLVLARTVLLMDRAAQFRNLESCGGKNVRVRLGPLYFISPEPALFGQPERTNGERPKF